MPRQSVQKITPAQQASFDQQIWPVMVAVTVLCGIGFGAILTILRGPWMWGSLFILPMIAAGSIFLLFHLDNHFLRRSLQFAIIISLGLHLIVLMVASAVNAFGISLEPHVPQVTQQAKVRTIEISDQRASFVWEEANAQETPEPEVEAKRTEVPTTVTKPQPVPVKETQPAVNPQLVKRATPSETVPRQNRDLSQRRRQTKNLKPQAIQQLTGQPTVDAATPAASAPPRAQPSATSAPRANSVAKQSVERAEPTESAAAPRSNPAPKVMRASSSPRRAAQSTTPMESAPQPSSSAARVRRSSARIPVAATPSPVAEKITTAASTQPVQANPSKSASQLTRRPTQSTARRPTPSQQTTTELSPRTQVARAARTQRTQQHRPSISNPNSTSQPPRRSTTASTIAMSPIPVENRARAPESKTASRELNSQTLSISRSTAGVTGSGRSNNLERSVGGMTSPAQRTSDSAQRTRTESRRSDTRMLVSSQKSETRRTVGSANLPSNALKSDTRFSAKLAGSSRPSERSLESSAAQISSAATQANDERSVEKGSASVDLGPTKIVMDQSSRRLSGGGQPEISQLNPESTRRSRDASNQQPTLVAAIGNEASAPNDLSSASPSTESTFEPSSDSQIATRQGGESTVTADRGTTTTGEISDAGQSKIAEVRADSRRRAERSSDESSWNEEEEDEKNLRGSQRSRIAQAPITRLQPGQGIANTEGRSAADPTTPGDSPMESAATSLTRTASDAQAGSGIGRSLPNASVSSENSLATKNRTRGRRDGRANSQATGTGLADSSQSQRPSRRSNRSNIASTVAGTTLDGLPNIANPGRSDADDSNLDSQSVSVSRSQSTGLKQPQGNRLEIDALDGPAGLGDRPADDVGIMARPASRDSEQIQPNLTSRFRKREFGGTPAISPDAVIAKEAFRKRAPSRMASSGEPTTEAAIQLGLKFLARYQLPNGSWSLTRFDQEAILHRNQLDSDTAATGLALLAFQGAGYNHREFEYANQIDKAILWLVENQSDDGGLYVSSDLKSDNACRLYSHGIAALALTEAYGMTQDPKLKLPAQRAIDYIIESQDPRYGGWRYFSEAAKKSSDTSVSGWMMMALQSARLAGLDVGSESFDGIDDWLDVAADPENESLYRYNPYGVDSKGVSRLKGRLPSTAMTSVGLLMRIYSGWDRADPRLLAGADYLLASKLPDDSSMDSRDTYYWYYATQVLKHVDGPRWKKWNDRLRPLLIRTQETSGDMAGSWDPYRPVPDRWGAFGGRLYVTTMNLLSLEVRHRMLPLYQQNLPEENDDKN